ncbi:MAG TPA: DUF899 domain-containing protein [Gaiellaceae bacterium]|jgi:predicted dithiol-disulfide oxidoreductase (DUF899 family)|nr:DUF899 domain-containing protein [Gaiellaceae bacterium]
MTAPNVATRDEWVAARKELLEREKELTRRSDELARKRRELPWVRIEKEYVFETEQGTKTLAELFDGRTQLLVYHFMFGPKYSAGCPTCSSIADTFDGVVAHLNHHDVTMLAISRAPLERLLAYKRRMGWRFPWASSYGGDFNFDFGVSFTSEQQRTGGEYNFRSFPTMQPIIEADAGPVAEQAVATGTDPAEYMMEAPGMSAFALMGEDVYHTYSAYARGLDVLMGYYQWLDRAPAGRNEGAGLWIRRHDEYE